MIYFWRGGRKSFVGWVRRVYAVTQHYQAGDFNLENAVANEPKKRCGGFVGANSFARTIIGA